MNKKGESFLRKILFSHRGQASAEIMVWIVAIVVIAAAISQQMKTPISLLHDKAVGGITTITGGGF